MTDQKKIKLSWETIHTGIESLAYQLEPLKPHLLVAVARGGLVPATLLSHKMNIDVEVVIARTYTGTRMVPRQQTEIVDFKEEWGNKGIIFVDDVVDSGSTIEALQQRLHGHGIIAALVNKQPQLYPLRHFCHVPLGVWVEFPWEVSKS